MGQLTASLYVDGSVYWVRDHKYYTDRRTGLWRARGIDVLVTADRSGRTSPEASRRWRRDRYGDSRWLALRERTPFFRPFEAHDWQVSRTHILFAEWLREVGPGDWRGLASLPITSVNGAHHLRDAPPESHRVREKWDLRVARFAPSMEPRALSGAVDVPAAGRYRCGARAGQGGCNPCREGRVPELLLEPDGRVRWGATGLAAETAERWGGLEGVWWEVGRFVVVGLRVPGPVEHDPIKIFPTPSVLLVLTRGEGPALTVLQCSWDNPVDGRAGPEPTPDLQDAVDALRCGAWWPQAPEHRIERR